MVVVDYSDEFKEQVMHNRRDEHSIVHPLLVTNEPELFVAVEDVVESFFESEEIAWKRVVNSPFPVSLESSVNHHSSSGSSTPAGCSSIHDTDNIIELIGDAFLRHEKSLQEIHLYFLKLDPRRICVKKVDEHCGVSQPLKLLESGTVTREHRGCNKRSSKKRKGTNLLSLEDKEIYKQLLKCAYHPPLDEPMPSPSSYSRGMSRNPSADVDAVSIERNRLIQKPMRAFHINQNLHDKLKNEILSKLPGRDFTMALSTELMDQMARLESNECHLYQPTDFANGDFYEDWKRQKIHFVNRLLSKWCSNCGCTLMAQIARSVNSHEAFKKIVKKFLLLDLSEKDETSNLKMSIKTVTSILTTESRKLLNEFCLWYGIDEIYRQLAILDAMAEFLSLNISDWYLECLLLGLMETMDFIIERKNFLVKAEKRMAESIFSRIIDQIEKAFVKIFYMYKKVLSGKGVETLVMLLQKIQEAKQFFRLIEEHEDRSIDSVLKTYMELAAIQHYRFIKGSAEFNYRQNEESISSSPSAEVLRQMLQDVRNCVKIAEDLANNCQLLFQKCPNILHLVADKLYSEFMKDVKECCFLNTDTIEFYDVNYEMMGLAFRLDKLDKDWIRFIPPEKQKWRRYFKVVLAVSITAITLHLSVEVTNYILKEESKILQLDLCRSACSLPVISSSELVQSIKLSDASAFTSVESSRNMKSCNVHLSPATSHSSLLSIKLIKNSLCRGSVTDIECKLNGNVSDHVAPIESCTYHEQAAPSLPEDTNELQNKDDLCISSINANTSDCLSEVNTVGMDDTDIMALEATSTLEEYIEYNKHAENIFVSPFNETDPSLENTVETIIGDIVDNIVKTCEQEHGEDYNGVSANFHYNIPETTPKATLTRHTLHNRKEVTVDGRHQVDINHQSKNMECSRRCYSEPINNNYATKGRCPNTKLSAAAIRYVRDGPTLDCSNDKNETYPVHQHDVICNFVLKDDVSCREVGSSTSFIKCTKQNTDENNPHHEFPENGQILTTTSVTDVLIACLRLISFANNACSIVLPSIDNESLTEIELIQENYNIQVDIFHKVLSSIKDILQSYATNVISLDNCGSKLFEPVQNRDVSQQVNEDCSRRREDIYVQDVIKGGLYVLPGCRHIREKVKPINNSHDGKPCPALKMLLDESFGKWELVSKQMCFRINNVYSLIKVMPILQKKVADGMKVNLEQLLARMDEEQTNEFSCYNNCPCKTPAKQFCFDFKQCHEYFSKILHIQVKLLTYRVMDIYSKLFNELRSLPQKQRSICEQMKSCLKYLRLQMKFFRHALYEKCVHLVVIEICKFIVDKFHELLDELWNSPEDPHVEVMNLKDTIMCTMRYLDADSDLKQQINKEMQVILFRFQIFFLPLGNIRSLFDAMEDINAKRAVQQLNASSYVIQELVYLVKRELDKNGKSVFNGSHFQNILLKNETWLNEFVSILKLDETLDVENKINAVGSYFLRRKYMKCCSIISNQSSNLEVVVRPASLPKDISIRLHIEGAGTSTKIEFPCDDVHQFEKSNEFVSPVSSVHSRRSNTTIEEPKPYIGSEWFFARDDVNYRFETKGETFGSLLLLLLTGELYNMSRQNGQWVETVTRKDIITIFSYEYHMNRTEDARNFFSTYKNILPFQPRRGSCFW